MTPNSPAQIIIRGLQGGKVGPAESAALEDFFKRLSDSAASANAFNEPGATRAAVIRRLRVDGDLAVPAGNITVGPIAPGRGNVIIDSAGIRLRNNTTNKINLTTGGDVMIGSDLMFPASTYISVFSVQQNYNSENFLAGDMLIGDNSTSKANMLWQKSSGSLRFRTGQTLTITLDAVGQLNFENNIPIYWKDHTGAQFKGQIILNGLDSLSIQNNTIGAKISLNFALTDGTFPSLDVSQDPGLANRSQYVFGAGVKGANITITDGSALPDTVIQTSGGSGGTSFATFPGAVNVGTGSSATAGELTVSGSATVATGVNVGTATGAATGDVLASGRIETSHGTWTPAFVGSGTAGVFTYTNQVGTYVKVGKLVYVYCRVTISAIGTPPTGNMSISGLPFTSEATNFHPLYFATITHLIYSATAKQITARVAPSATTITLLESISAAGAPAVLAANFTDVACEMILGGWYAIP